jgi:hypothetical protein
MPQSPTLSPQSPILKHSPVASRSIQNPSFIDSTSVPRPLSPSYAPIKDSYGKFKCTYCPKSFKHQGRWLSNHIKTCNSNPNSELKSPKIESFIHNGNKFIVNKRVRHFPKSDDINFLRDFNLTPCNKNIVRELDDSNVFMDKAFCGTNMLATRLVASIFVPQNDSQKFFVHDL